MMEMCKEKRDGYVGELEENDSGRWSVDRWQVYQAGDNQPSGHPCFRHVWETGSDSVLGAVAKLQTVPKMRLAASIGVGAQSTLGLKMFLPENIRKIVWKINKMLEIYMMFTWKIYFPEFSGQMLPNPRLLRLWLHQLRVANKADAKYGTHLMGVWGSAPVDQRLCRLKLNAFALTVRPKSDPNLNSSRSVA